MPDKFWSEGRSLEAVVRAAAAQKSPGREGAVLRESPSTKALVGAKGCGKTWAATEVIQSDPDIWRILWPEDPAPGGEWSGGYAPPPGITRDRPLEFSTYSRGRQDLLAHGRGVPSTVEIDGVEHLVAAIITSKDGFVWTAPPDPFQVTKKVGRVRQECREALSKTPWVDLPVQTSLIANGEPRVITVLRGNRHGPGWYVYLCVPRPPEDTNQPPEPKKPSRSRFKHLEL